MSANSIIEEFGLKFELIEARMASRKAIIQIKITNPHEDDIEFAVEIGWPKKYSTMIYDNTGNEYSISGIKLGNKFRNLKNSVTQYDGENTKLIAGNSVNMELHFDNISSQTTKISLLQINCTRKMGMLEFRNIMLNK